MKKAYCSGCGSYVELDEDEMCPGRHARSCYRGVTPAMPGSPASGPFAAPSVTPPFAEAGVAPQFGPSVKAVAMPSDVASPGSVGDAVKSRLRGVLLMGVGLLAFKAQIWDPLHAAELELETVQVWTLGVFAGIALPWLGFAYLVFGQKVDAWVWRFRLMNRNDLRPRDVAILLLASVPVLIVWVIIQHSLLAAGYH